jgi:hypothetical protein
LKTAKNGILFAVCETKCCAVPPGGCGGLPVIQAVVFGFAFAKQSFLGDPSRS